MSGRVTRIAVIGLIVITVLAALPWAITFTFLKMAESHFGMTIRGEWRPRYFSPGSFVLRKASVDWDDYGRVLSGYLEVSFNPVLFLFSKGVLSIEGRELEIHLGERYSEAVPVKRFQVKHFQTVLKLNSGGLPAVSSFDIDSPAIHFNLREKSTRNGKIIG